jgi:uncharacterized protein YkwD
VPVLFAIASLLVSAAVAQSGAQASSFGDVYDNNAHLQAIEWMKAEDIAKGYTDGSFRPDRWVNRAEAVKMMVTAKDLTAETKDCTSTPFADVGEDDWFLPYVCVATQKGWLETSSDDSAFRPSDTINAGELSVLLARIYGYQVEKGGPWFAPAVQALGSRHIIPIDIEAAGQSVSRSQLAEMLWRLETAPHTASSADPDTLVGVQCDWQPDHDIPAVDDQEVTRAWMTWVNDLREKRGLVPYAPDRQLSRTAQEWSDEARAGGTISHKREGQTAYYDYNRMVDWFAANDLDFANVHSTTFTENIGWGVYRCKKTDCTAEFIDALRTTFDFYLAEENKASRPHWNSMVNQDFRLAGIGISVDEESGKYYFTAHYGTAITSDPAPVCP